MGVIIVNRVATQIRIDKDLKQQVSSLFLELGLDMSSAVNVFLKQCLLHRGLPFSVVIPEYKQEVVEAMNEARKLSNNPKTKRYSSFKEALKDLEK